jgi:hypothetical protein
MLNNQRVTNCNYGYLWILISIFTGTWWYMMIHDLILDVDLCLYTYIRCNYIPWPSLDKIFHDFSRPSWFHISFQKAPCRSWRVAGNHADLGAPRCPQCTSNPRFSLSPMHTDGRATLACVWIFRLLVSPSNRKAEKATLPLIGRQQELPLLSLYLVLRTFAGYLRAFCGAFLSHKMWFSGHLIIIHLGWRQAPQCSAEQIVFCLTS